MALNLAASASHRFLQAQDSPTSAMQSGHRARPQDRHTAMASEFRWVKHFMILVDSGVLKKDDKTVGRTFGFGAGLRPAEPAVSADAKMGHQNASKAFRNGARES
jgi:hypothetical protein